MQDIRTIPLSDLHLWTENPRDPISVDASDYDIITRAISDNSNTWELDKLLSNFGGFYHQNKLPVVVEINEKYIVYDGNRRVAMLKCIQDEDLFSLATGKLKLFDPPQELFEIRELPCDVCDLSMALDIVEHDHKGAGKWGMLQYEWFLNIHRGQQKGTLAIIEEAFPGSISQTKLNEEYAQSRLLTKSNLNRIGFNIEDEHLVSVYSKKDARDIFEDLATAREKGITSHRKNPGDIVAALKEMNPKKYNQIQNFESNEQVTDHTEDAKKAEPPSPVSNPKKKRRKPLKKQKHQALFNGALYPKGDKSNQIYRALDDIYSLYLKHPDSNEHLLPIVAMGLRLLLDTVAREYYIEHEDELAQQDAVYKTFLNSVAKTALSKQTDKASLNSLSLSQKWLNSEINLEGILGKWAHGSMPVSIDSVLETSQIVGDIIRATWSS